LGEVTFFSINHHLSIKSSVNADYKDIGTIKILGSQLLNFIKQLPPGTVDISVHFPDELHIRCQDCCAKMQILQDIAPSENITFAPAVSLSVQGHVLEKWVSGFKDFISVDEPNVFANGSLIQFKNDHLTAVASDAVCLAKVSTKNGITPRLTHEAQVVVPKKTMEEIRRVSAQSLQKDFIISWDEKGQFFSFEGENYHLISKCLVVDYPPYDAAIPQNITQTVTVNIKSLLTSIRRVMIFSDKETKILSLSFEKNYVKIQGFTPGQKEAEDKIPLESPCHSPFVVNYNGIMLTNILSSLSGSIATFSWENPFRAVKITGEDEKDVDAFYLLVPLRY